MNYAKSGLKKLKEEMKNNNIINDLDKIALIELEDVKRDDNFRIIKRSSYMYNCISYSIDVDSVYIWPSVKGLVYLDKPNLNF